MAAAQKGTIGKNIEYTFDGKKLTLEIDCTKSQGDSKSGKNTIIATSAGNATVGDVRVGLNVYRNK